MLTDSRARAISGLPGVLDASPNTVYRLSTPTMEAKAIVERVRAPNAARRDADQYTCDGS